ncbi:MAG: S9 family peptidase [Planctomycetia bacterium]|nr:S9 family peptidase [Planctomycetia bacterium]
MLWFRLVIIPMLITALAVSISAQDGIKYPATKRIEHVDDYHGTKVPDPYRWLENDVRVDAEVKAWVEAQNKVTFDYLATLPERENIKKRLTELWNYEKVSAPFKVAGRYYFSRNDGLQNQNVFYVQDTLDSKPELLIDPNTWSKDGTIAMAGMALSEDGKYLAYGIADAGSDWSTWKVMRLADRKVLDDEIKWMKYSGISWTKDGKGFFYSRFPEPAADQKFQSLTLNQKVYYHRVGTPQSDDVLVYERPDQPKWGFGAQVSEDGKYLVINIRIGTSALHKVVYKDLEEPYGTFKELVGNFENEYSFVDNDGPVFFFKTNNGATRGRVVAIDIRNPDQKNWKVIIPEVAETLQSVGNTGNFLIANYLKNAQSQIKIFTTAGKLVREVQLPGVGTAGGFGGRKQDLDTFYTYTSFTTPPTVYHYDLITGESKLFRKPDVKFNPDDYEVKQVFYPSKDGTKIPMFIAHKKGVKLDSNNPTLLYGYGGFNIPMVPGFSVSRLNWMEMGGVFAMACLRGGGEYGEEWHAAGTKLKKQNVFDDFIAAAEWLVANKYTNPKKLGIQGGSNGGLLVGACMTQRPELFGACLPAVGVMDMLRFQKFTAGRFWTDDYGSSDNPEEFKALLKYSPYHNFKPGVSYPPTLVTTADTDDRVVPGHSFKFTAMMQHCHSGSNPVLARIETRAGHGAGKPTAKVIEETADQWAFLVKHLGLKK